MQIRKVNLNDIEELCEIEKECFIAPFDAKALKSEILENEFSKIFVLIDDKKIIGFIDYWITFDSSTVCQIGVRKEFRHQGIGQKLLDLMFEDLKQNEVFVSTLEVRATNINAIKFYEKYGYIKDHVMKNYYSNGDDAIYMMRGV